nr:metal-dependent transcriptional regulator [uncultured Acetatifactor sp.]
MKQKKSVEDYLKTIYTLSKRKAVHGSDIAGELGVSRPTVSVALKDLAEEGYVFVDGTYEVHLTEKGKRIAEDTYERHSTFCRLLTGLGVDKKTAAVDACKMEHAVSRESYEALKTLAALKNDRDS